MSLEPQVRQVVTLVERTIVESTDIFRDNQAGHVGTDERAVSDSRDTVHLTIHSKGGRNYKRFDFRLFVNG